MTHQTNSELTRLHPKESSVVTRLLVVLLCLSCYLTVVAPAHVSHAQDVAPDSKTTTKENSETPQDPDPAESSKAKAEKSKPETAKQEPAKPKSEAAKQDAKKSESSKQETDKPKTDQPKTKTPEATAPETGKQDPEKKDAAKSDEAKSEAAKSEAAKQKPESKSSTTESTKPGSAKPVMAPSVGDPAVSKPAASDSPNSEADAPREPQQAEAKQVSPDKNPIHSEHLLPASTKFWVSIPDAKKLEQQFNATQFGMLAKDPSVKPFIDSLRDQIKGFMDEQNVSLGIEIDDIQGVHSGEICIAGVLPDNDGKQLVKGSHALIVLFDVTGSRQKALDLQIKINEQLKKRGAEIEQMEINGVNVTKSTLRKQKPIRMSQSNFQAIVNDWMLVSDNEKIFREVLRRVAAPAKIQKADALVGLPAFAEIMKQTDLKENEAHLRWFIDPFGYIQLAQALEDEKQGDLQPRNDWSKILKEEGFGALKGVGGNVSVATGDHELLHQTFTFAPPNQQIKNNEQLFRMFNFSGNSEPLEPANWVPENSSSFIVGNWNFSDALTSVGSIYDAFTDKGAFERMLNDFKVDPDMQLDIEKLIGLLNNRITVVTTVDRPINESSERVVIGIPITGEPKFIFESLRRATDGQVIKLGGIDVIEVDSAAQVDEFEDETFLLPGELPMEEEEPEQPEFQLFAKRYFAVHKGNLLVANNKDYIRQLLFKKNESLAEAKDYIQIKESIGELTDSSKICWRQFGRIDRALETNYEMLRRGEMAESQTMLARVINQIFAKQAANRAAAEGKALDENMVRKQKLDGSKLPADYQKNIAPYFGPMGWVVEKGDDGWRITGCIVKKKGMTEVVQKTDDDDVESRQR